MREIEHLPRDIQALRKSKRQRQLTSHFFPSSSQKRNFRFLLLLLLLLPPEHQQHTRPNSHNTHTASSRKRKWNSPSTGNELLASPLQRRDWSFGAHTQAVGGGGGGGGGRAALTLWNGRKKGGKGRLRTHRRRREEEEEEHFKSPFAAYALACVRRGKERGPPLTIIISRITQVFFFFLFRLRDVQMWIFLLSSPLFSSPRLC